MTTWEPIIPQVERLEVPGGWIYQIWQGDQPQVTFVPNPLTPTPIMGPTYYPPTYVNDWEPLMRMKREEN